MAIAGIGALVAGWAFMKFKAPDVVDDIKKFTFDKLDGFADAIFPSTPVEFRRRAQSLAAERARLASAEAVFCSYSSERYDAAQCSATFQEKELYFEELRSFQNEVIAATAVGGPLHHYDNTWWKFIFGNLGDIDPNEDSNPNNDVDLQDENPDSWRPDPNQ